MSAGISGRWAALALAAALVLLAAACGGKAKQGTTSTAAPTTSTPTLTTTESGTPASCSAWGKSWMVSFNKTAAKQGNPERITSACCGPQSAAGVSHCLISLTLVGTTDRGCESVDLGRDGTPTSIGQHVVCGPKK